MKIRTLIKKITVKSCIYFSVITALYSLLTFLTHLDEMPVLINAGNVLLFFVFSIIIATANSVLSFPSLKAGTKIFLHFIITLFGFYTCFLLPISPTSAGYLVGIVCFSIIYFIITGIVAIFRSRLKRNTEKAEAYTNQYKKKF